jgi:hypothetical protein
MIKLPRFLTIHAQGAFGRHFYIKACLRLYRNSYYRVTSTNVIALHGSKNFKVEMIFLEIQLELKFPIKVEIDKIH